MSSLITNKWYVAQIKPNGFVQAVANLRRQGFLTFMPMQKVTVRHARKLRDVLRPVFPGYLFIEFGADRADWRKINSTLGVVRLVGFEKSSPSPVPDDLISGLQARCNDEQCLRPENDLAVGEKVKMVAGAFAGFIAEIERLNDNERVSVLMDLMGQNMRVELRKEQLVRL